jgi:hypothetical protein
MFDFAEETSNMSAIEILNYYRNLYYAEPQVAERGIVANAINDMLDLINRQKSEIERLKGSTIVNNIIERNRIKKEAKAEAYKEFAEKIKQEIKEAYDNNIEVLNEHFEKHRGCFNDTFVGIIEGKNNALLGLSDFIDNLLKEMVGEE